MEVLLLLFKKDQKSHGKTQKTEENRENRENRQVGAELGVVVVSCCRSGVPTVQPRGTRGTRGSPSVLHALDALDGIDGTDGTVVSLVSQLGIATWHDLRFLPCGYHVAIIWL